jgi:hypothetical protein
VQVAPLGDLAQSLGRDIAREDDGRADGPNNAANHTHEFILVSLPLERRGARKYVGDQSGLAQVAGLRSDQRALV